MVQIQSENVVNVEVENEGRKECKWWMVEMDVFNLGAYTVKKIDWFGCIVG